MLTVLVIDESRSRAGEICAGLALSGYQVAAILAGADNLTAEVERLQPDVIRIDTESPSRDTLENLAAMNKNMPRPVVIFTQEDGQATIRDAVKAGVSAYIVDGLDPEAHQAHRRSGARPFRRYAGIASRTRRDVAEAFRPQSGLQGQGRADEGTRHRRGRRLSCDAQAGHGTWPDDGQGSPRRHRHGARPALIFPVVVRRVQVAALQ